MTFSYLYAIVYLKMIKQTVLEKRLTEEEIKEHLENTPVDFVDYLMLITPKEIREKQKAAFLSGEEYIPDYTYPELDRLEFDKKIRYAKHSIYKAMMGLEALQHDSKGDDEVDLYREFYAKNLHKIMLAEAARDLKDAQDSAQWETEEKSFSDLNVEVYGEFDTESYGSMMSTEFMNATNFVPKSDSAETIKAELLSYLGGFESGYEPEKPLIEAEDLQKIHEVVTERYQGVLSIIPETDDSVYYDARQSVDIINEIFKADGVNWKCEIRSDISGAGTAPGNVLALPTNFRRNAQELRRFVVHEKEIHIRRQDNGKSSGKLFLEKGTANYGDVEEGIGVRLVIAVDGNIDDHPAINRARDRYITAGLALGTENEPTRDARQVYEVLWRILAVRNSNDGEISDVAINEAKEQAYVHIENAFRGTEFWMRGMIFSKLKIYYEGLKKNAKFLVDNINDINGALDDITIGKYDHTDETERKKVKKIVKTPS